MASRDQLAKEVSERKHAEEALKESEERFRSIVENSHEGILIVDNNYKLIYGNDKFGEILGYPLEEIIGRDFRNFLDEESKEFVADNYRKRQKEKICPPYMNSILSGSTVKKDAWK